MKFNLLLPSILFLSFLLFACTSDDTKEKSASEETETETEEKIELDSALDEPFDTVARDQVRESLQAVFETVKTGNAAQLAEKMAYKGSDEERSLQVRLDFNNSNEKFTAESTFEVIQIWLNGAENKEYGVYLEDKENGIPLFTQEVVFMAELNTERRQFTFVKLDEGYYLANIK